MRRVRAATAGILDQATLAHICQQVDRARTQAEEADALMYHI